MAEYDTNMQRVCIEGIFTMLMKCLPRQKPEDLYLLAIQIENERHKKNDKS